MVQLDILGLFGPEHRKGGELKMINREYFDKICEDYYVHISDVEEKPEFIYLLTNQFGDVDGWSDAPCYSEDAEAMHVIETSEIDEETWKHLIEDCGRCAIKKEKRQRGSKDYPIPISEENGVFVAHVKYNKKKHLIQAQLAKEEELAQASDEGIREGFEFEIKPKHIVRFPFDETAQKNFQGAMQLFDKGILQAIPWTVYNMEDEIERIMITKEMSDGLSIAAMLHTNSHISRFRDELMPKVNKAKTWKEVEQVIWKDDYAAVRGFSDTSKCFLYAKQQGIPLGGIES